MNRLEVFEPSEEKLHRECLYSKIIKNLDAINVSDYTKDGNEVAFFRRYLSAVRSYVIKNDCLVAHADELRRMVKDVERKFLKWQPIAPKSPLLKFNEALESAFGYSSFRDKKGRKNDDWGGEVLMRKLMEGVRYCPYCNAETVYAIEMEAGGKGRPPLIKAAFDHFYPKGRYPFLSVSLYNLIPSCHRCNSQFKIAQFKKLSETLHPYLDSVEEDMCFCPGAIPPSVWDGGEDDPDFEIRFVPRRGRSTVKERRGRNFGELFQIERVYSQLYRREAIQILQKVRAYGDSYLNQVREWFAAAGMENVDIEKMVFGTPEDPKEINKHRHAKLLRDMMNFWRCEGDRCVKG